jgi:hypothetical protein
MMFPVLGRSGDVAAAPDPAHPGGVTVGRPGDPRRVDVDLGAVLADRMDLGGQVLVGRQGTDHQDQHPEHRRDHALDAAAASAGQVRRGRKWHP